jgi:hypothetical protein
VRGGHSGCSSKLLAIISITLETTMFSFLKKNSVCTTLCLFMPKASYFSFSLYQSQTVTGRKTSRIKKNNAKMIERFFLFNKALGKAIATLKLLFPSALPNLAHFSLVSSSVRHL